MTLHLGAAMILEHRGDEMILDVGRGQVGARFPEAPRLGETGRHNPAASGAMFEDRLHHPPGAARAVAERIGRARLPARHIRSEEHTSELQSLMRISYAVFCLKKKKQPTMKTPQINTD